MTSRLPPWGGSPAPSSRPIERIEPTPAEVANGWDTESLSKYVAERRAAQAAALDPAARRPVRPQQAKGHHWSFPARRSRQIKTPSWQR
jgi:hypothetical protein